MQNNPGQRLSNTARYLFFGILLGSIFPLLALLIDYFSNYQSEILDNLAETFQSQPIAWLLFGMPIVMGILGAVTGRRIDVISHFAVQQKWKSGGSPAELIDLNEKLSTEANEQNKLEAILSRGKREWESIFDAVRDSILVVDGDGVIIRCNRSAVDWFQLPFNHIIKHQLIDLIANNAGVEPGALPELKGEVQIPGKPGWHEIFPYPTRLGENVYGTIYIFRDISDRKEAESMIRQQKQYLEVLVNTSPVAIVTLDLEKKVLSHNTQFCTLFGYSSDEILGQDLDSLLIPDKLLGEATQFTNRVLSGEII
jgi:PAS domain-containing protein